MTRYFVLAFLLLFSASAQASTLFGRVVEVNDGDVITVFNLNRPVRIKLMAVDAPEARQEFGEVARKHLSDLVYDKSVLVEYWGIAADGSLVGRVTLNGVDVGAQMIRDGAAWFDASNQIHLSATDRDVYQQSEQAARHERRGLWQAENPVAPWEFVRAAALKRTPVASLKSIEPAATVKANRPTSELTNMTLLAARANNAAAANVDPELAWAVDTSVKNWDVFKASGENFSADMPQGGKQVKMPLQVGDQTIDINVYMVRDGGAIYTTMWMTGPTTGETDKVALDSTVVGFLKGISEGYQSEGGNAFSCELQREKNVSMNGYLGREYDLPSCTVPGKLRVFTKLFGDRRKVYCGAVFYLQQDPNISRFLQSFTVRAATPKAKRR